MFDSIKQRIKNFIGEAVINALPEAEEVDEKELRKQAVGLVKEGVLEALRELESYQLIASQLIRKEDKEPN